MAKKHTNNEEEKQTCHCHEEYEECCCEHDECCCDDDCGCGHDCHCGDECNCNEHRRCSEHCNCGQEPKINEINLDYLDLAQRLKAEFDNYKRRNAELSKESFENGVTEVVKKLLPVLDGFHQAKKNIKDASVLEGVELLQKQLLDALGSFGVTKIECINQPFDPCLHNAVVAMEVEGVEPDMVVEEYQEGFRMKDKIIRHSVVRISK